MKRKTTYYGINGFSCQRNQHHASKNVTIEGISGYKCFKVHDKNGNVVYFEDSNGNKEWFDYDKDGNILNCRDNYGNNHWFDNDGCMVSDPLHIFLLSKKIEKEELGILLLQKTINYCYEK